MNAVYRMEIISLEAMQAMNRTELNRLQMGISRTGSPTRRDFTYVFPDDDGEDEGEGYETWYVTGGER